MTPGRPRFPYQQSSYRSPVRPNGNPGFRPSTWIPPQNHSFGNRGNQQSRPGQVRAIEQQQEMEYFTYSEYDYPHYDEFQEQPDYSYIRTIDHVHEPFDYQDSGEHYTNQHTLEYYPDDTYYPPLDPTPPTQNDISPQTNSSHQQQEDTVENDEVQQEQDATVEIDEEVIAVVKNYPPKQKNVIEIASAIAKWMKKTVTKDVLLLQN